MGGSAAALAALAAAAAAEAPAQFAPHMRCDACQVLAAELGRRCAVPRRSGLPLSAFTADVVDEALAAAKGDWHWVDGLGARAIAVDTEVRLKSGGELAGPGDGPLQRPEATARVERIERTRVYVRTSTGQEHSYHFDDLRRVAARGRFRPVAELRALYLGGVDRLPAEDRLTGKLLPLAELLKVLRKRRDAAEAAFAAQRAKEGEGPNPSSELLRLGLALDKAKAELEEQQGCAAGSAQREHASIGDTLRRLDRHKSALPGGRAEVDLRLSEFMQDTADDHESAVERIVSGCQRAPGEWPQRRIAEELCVRAARHCPGPEAVQHSYPPRAAPNPGEQPEPEVEQEDEGEL